MLPGAKKNFAEFLLIKKPYLLQGIVWLFFIIITTWAINRDEKDLAYSIPYTLVYYFFIITFINCGFYLVDLFYKKGKYLLFVVAILTSIGILSISENYILKKFFEDYTSLLQHASNLFFIFLIAAGFRFFKDGLVSQLQRKEARSQRLESELSYLRSQINAHFLFNTLNNMYGASLQDPTRSPEMILALSDLLRYQLESSKQDYVSLSQELTFLDNYVALEKLHCTPLNQVKFGISGTINGQQIAPMLLLPFVENAFKHGLHPAQESFITIAIDVNEEVLCLQVENSLLQRKNGYASTGIGIRNVEKRLDLVYPDRYQLQVRQEAQIYQAQLNIQL